MNHHIYESFIDKYAHSNVTYICNNYEHTSILYISTLYITNVHSPMYSLHFISILIPTFVIVYLTVYFERPLTHLK